MWQTISNNFILGISIFFGVLASLYVFQVNLNLASITNDCSIIQSHDEKSVVNSDASKLKCNTSYQASNAKPLINACLFNYKSPYFILFIVAVLSFALFWKRQYNFLEIGYENFKDDRKILRLIDCIKDSLQKKYDLSQITSKNKKLDDRERLFLSFNCYKNKSDSLLDDYNHEHNIGQLSATSGFKAIEQQDIIESAKILLDISYKIDYKLDDQLVCLTEDTDMSRGDIQTDCTSLQVVNDIVIHEDWLSNNVLNSTNNNNEVTKSHISELRVKFNKRSCDNRLSNIYNSISILPTTEKPNQCDSNHDDKILNFADNDLEYCMEIKEDVEHLNSNVVADMSACFLDEEALIEDTAKSFSEEARKLWPKVVSMIKQRELSISKKIVDCNGDKKVLWAWIPHSPTNNTNMWQGPAVYAPMRINPPTPCLKIRNMINERFVANNRADWKEVLRKSIQEKTNLTKEIEDIIFIEEETCVCLKCADEKSAGKIFESINGWWFGGNLISVKFLPLKRFLVKKRQNDGCTNLKSDLTDDSIIRWTLNRRKGRKIAVTENSTVKDPPKNIRGGFERENDFKSNILNMFTSIPV